MHQYRHLSSGLCGSNSESDGFVESRDERLRIQLSKRMAEVQPALSSGIQDEGRHCPPTTSTAHAMTLIGDISGGAVTNSQILEAKDKVIVG